MLPKNENLTFIKTVLMLLVIAYHACIFWNGTWFGRAPAIPSEGLNILSQWLNSFMMQGFFLVSGYIFCFKRCECDAYRQFMPFMVNKIKRLIVPYIFVSAVWVIPAEIMTSGYGVEEIVKKFVFGTGPSQLWFLLTLFWVFLIFWLLNGIFDKPTWGVFLTVCLYGIGIIMKHFLTNVFQIWTSLQYLIFFYMGYKLRQTHCSIVERIPVILWPILHAVVFGGTQLFTFAADAIFIKALRVFMTLFLHILGGLSAFFVLQKAAGRFERKKWIRRLGRYAMPIYLFHQQIIYGTIVLFDGKLNPYIHAAVNFAVALLISLGLAVVLLKGKVTRILVGEKADLYRL